MHIQSQTKAKLRTFFNIVIYSLNNYNKMKNRNPSSIFFKKMEIVIEEENLKFRGRIYITGSGDVDVIRTEGKNGIVLVNNTEQQNLRSEKRWQ